MDDIHCAHAAGTGLHGTSRRGVMGLTLGSSLALLLGASTTTAKRAKKRCRTGATRCAKTCCGAPSSCRASVCYCTGQEPPRGRAARADGTCVEVQATLIAIIAEETNLAPAVIGAAPQQPLIDQVTIDPATLAAIDALLKQTFLIEEPVPYYTEGIEAAVAIIRQEIQVKG